jgi:CheY-like chemotaxis protein
VATSAAESQGARGARGSVRILVVDDSDELRERITAWLEDEGYAVVTAESGRDALDTAAAYYPDIVLLELVDPPPDGFAVCEALRNRLSPQVILMTASPGPQLSHRAVDLDALSLLRKPLTRAAVIDAVTIAAERCRRDPLSKLRWHFGEHPRA